jgi:two-component system, sensor histidine kinase and response regulator
MSSSSSLRFSHPVSPLVLDQIVALLQEMKGEQGIFLSSLALSPQDELPLPYALVVTPPFSALMLVQPALAQPADQTQPAYQISLNFVPATIAQFLQDLPDAPPIDGLRPTGGHRIAANEPQPQTEFTLKLLAILTASHPASATPSMAAGRSATIAAAASLAEQAQLLNQVTQAIRQSLELPAVLETAVHQVRAFLQVDRLLIHQFDIPAPVCAVDFGHADAAMPPVASLDGITYEARAHDHIPSVLNQMGDHWINAASHLRQKYSAGEITAKDNVEGFPELAALVKLPEAAAVRSELTIPVLVQNELWGLLIAHQCDQQRQWTQVEKQFLQQIVDQLSIAIYQARLFGQLQAQANTLEKMVADRTQELRDALVAAQAADRAKTEFLATMSHELRTPLTCIIGMSSTLLRNNLQGLLPLARQQSHLQIIHDRGANLLTLINDILELANIESERMTLNVRDFSLPQLVSQTLKEMEVRATQQQVRLVLDLPPELMPNGRFRADPQRIRQILLNLLSNSVKFTPMGGQVTLRLRLVQKMATIQVEDTGIGIPPEQQHLLFQKFQQIDSSYQRQYEGTGLGLALTKQLVEVHGGKIEFTSQVNVGSIFTVKLPEQSMAANGLARERAKLTVYARVMLIEAIEEQANFICDLLTAADYQVIWMTDAETAIYQIEATQPMLAIVNCNIPDAEQIVTRLKEAATTIPMKILAIIPHLDDRDRFKQMGADDCLTATIAQPEQLIDKVTSLASHA